MWIVLVGFGAIVMLLVVGLVPMARLRSKTWKVDDAPL